MENRKLKIALIGAGGMGKRWFRSLQQVKTVSLITVVDTDLTKAESLASQIGSCQATNDWRKVINDPNVNAVLVVTPNKYLAPISIAALSRKKHVLCEKPGGIKSSQIKKAISIAKMNAVCYMIGFSYRQHEAFIKARSLVDKGDIGKIIFIRARHGFGGRPNYQKEWRFQKSLSGGGELIDQGIHMIDLCLSFIGYPSKIAGFVADTFWHGGVEDNAFVLMKNKNNQIASVHVSWTQWKPIHSFEIYGSRGFLSIEGLGRRYGGTERLIVGKRSPDFASVSEKIIDCNPEADNALIREAKEFVAAIKQKRDPNPAGVSAYETLKVVEAVYK